MMMPTKRISGQDGSYYLGKDRATKNRKMNKEFVKDFLGHPLFPNLKNVFGGNVEEVMGHVPQKELAPAAMAQPQNVKRGVKRVVERNDDERVSQEGRRVIQKPDFAWFGPENE